MPFSPSEWLWPMAMVTEALPSVQKLLLYSTSLLSNTAVRRPRQLGSINVIPLPSAYSTGNSVICLNEQSFTVTFSGQHVPDDLKTAMSLVQDRVVRNRHAFLSPTRGAEFFGSAVGHCDSTLSTLTLHLSTSSSSQSIASDAITPVEERKALEQYRLQVHDGQATLEADSYLGLYRGLATFQQLWYNHQDTVYAPYGPYVIDDTPEFGWRSVMIDTSRHYLPVAVIKKQVDAMSLVKLNVLHWHITDSQSWPLDLRDYPDLVQGSYPGSVYTEENVKEVVKYAAERGVDVLVEIDTPGHTASLIHSHPDYIACYDHSQAQNANEPPAGQLRFANDTIVDFAAGLFTSLAGVVGSRYVSTGGDELNVHCMMSDALTLASLEEKGWTLDQALDAFTARSHDALAIANKTPTVWQEMVLEHNVTLAHNPIVHIWRNSKDAKDVIEKGFRIVHAASDYFYLDCGIGEWIGTLGGGQSWCDPFKSWARMYSFDPYANVSAGQRPLVLGGQASLWAEQVDETNLETLLWPRAVALAEVFWTRPKNAYPMNSIDALPRMHDVRYRMVEMGMRAVPLQPQWCAFHPGRCNLES